jgi:regulator of nonsense transcripts 2
MAEAEAERKEQRRRNGNASRERPSDAQLKRRDSSLKRNNAMSRKLRSITSTSKQQIEEELPKLNLSKYLDEAVSSIAEGRLKPSDLPAAVSICSALHLTYPSFASLLAPQLAKLATGGSALDSGEPLPASQRKVKLRFLAELVLVHVVHDASLLVNAVKDVCSAHVEPSGAGTGGGAHLSVAASFSKHCAPHLIGTSTSGSPNERYDDAESEDCSLLSREHRAALFRALESCFEHARMTLLDEHCQLEAAEREAARQDELRGDDSAMAAHERERRSFEQLWKNVSMLAEGIGKEMPQISDQVCWPRDLNDCGISYLRAIAHCTAMSPPLRCRAKDLKRSMQKVRRGKVKKSSLFGVTTKRAVSTKTWSI